MDEFDYCAAAELFPTRRRPSVRQSFGYKRFAQASQAIRFAVEDLPPECLVGAFLEVDEQRYGSDDIRRLYQSSEYPLNPSRSTIMTDKTVDLDRHRGMAEQKATKLRRLLADVEANEKALRVRQEELESHLVATLAAEDTRRQKLIAAVLADLSRLSEESLSAFGIIGLFLGPAILAACESAPRVRGQQE
jgi:hypothetical protein